MNIDVVITWVDGNDPKWKAEKEKYDKLKVLILAMALDLEMFENAYLSSVVHNQISNALKIKFSTRLFAESTLDIISPAHIQLP